MKTDRKISDDTQLRKLMSTLPAAPADPWFTRKVLNRLPQRKRHIAARIEIWTCAAGAVLTAILGVRFALSTVKLPTITVGDIFTYAVYLTLFGALVTNVAMPLIRMRAQRALDN